MWFRKIIFLLSIGFSSIYAFNNLSDHFKYNIHNYSITISQQIKLNKNIPISQRNIIRRHAKDDLLKLTGQVLENIYIDNYFMLKDLFAHNETFSRKYSIFLDSLELKNFFFRNNKIYGSMKITLRGQHGLLSIIPLPWNKKQYQALKLKTKNLPGYISYPYFNEYEKNLSPVKYTGLVIDARDSSLKMSLSPRIYTQSGKLIYGPEFIYRKIGISRGIVGYVKNIYDPIVKRRAGSKYLLALALSSSGKNNTDLVISEKDAQKLLEHKTTVTNLRKCKVVFLINKIQ